MLMMIPARPSPDGDRGSNQPGNTVATNVTNSVIRGMLYPGKPRKQANQLPQAQRKEETAMAVAHWRKFNGVSYSSLNDPEACLTNWPWL
eukprot:scaffold3610_cov530-Pavlova_lutheri.AAC.1